MLEERVHAVAVQQRWEYRCERIESLDNLEAMLNEVGGHHWELVSVVAREGETRAVFKRPQRLFTQRREPASASDALVLPRQPK